jgi:hypothetical protein
MFSCKAAEFAKVDEYIMTLIKDKKNHHNFALAVPLPEKQN